MTPPTYTITWTRTDVVTYSVTVRLSTSWPPWAGCPRPTSSLLTLVTWSASAI